MLELNFEKADGLGITLDLLGTYSRVSYKRTVWTTRPRKIIDKAQKKHIN